MNFNSYPNPEMAFKLCRLISNMQAILNETFLFEIDHRLFDYILEKYEIRNFDPQYFCEDFLGSECMLQAQQLLKKDCDHSIYKDTLIFNILNSDRIICSFAKCSGNKFKDPKDNAEFFANIVIVYNQQIQEQKNIQLASATSQGNDNCQQYSNHIN